MGLPAHNGKSTAAAVAVEEPQLSCLTPAPATVEIHFRQKNKPGRAKPPGVSGLQLCWTLAATPPVDWSELHCYEFAAHTPTRLSFEGNDRGKWLYIVDRWQKSNGSKGPWCEIASCVVP
jgi:hypothetical protein